MNYRLQIRPQALADIAEAAQWYEEREPGLGARLVRETLRAIDTLTNNPLAYRIRLRRKNIRWKVLDRFPYRVVYQTNDNLITVLAVIHSARHERHWQARL